MEPSEIGDTQRQVAIRALFGAVYERMAGAVHRLERITTMPPVGTGIDRLGVGTPLTVGGQEHVLAEIVPMARGVPQFVFENLWGNDLVEAVAPIEAAHVIDQLVINYCAPWE